MASVSKDKNGTKRITYYDSDKKQVCIRLGKVSKKIADTVKIHVENLVSARAAKVSVDEATADWLTKISDELHQKFAQKGFVPPRRVIGTLGEMIPKIIEEKSADTKQATIDVYRQSEKSLYRYFGEDRRVDQITEAEAKEFSVWLAKQGSLKKSSPLAQSTVSKRMRQAILFFNELVKTGDISDNPFSGLDKDAGVDETRNRYIDEETILKVMEYAPDAEWRLIIALWRFAGLRAFSEVLMLKWEDILWDQEKILVHAPKTERYKGKAFRKIPFFPHIEECLMEAAEQAPVGSIYVVEKHAPLYLRGQKERVYVSRQGNMGTMFKKMMLRAGIVPWPKLLHNLRASLETDLLNGKYGEYGIHTIAEWLGHSVQVMLKHYGRIQQADYDKIAVASQEAKMRKKQAIGTGKADFSAFSPQNDGFALENTDSDPFESVSWKASWNTAAGGEMGGNGAESTLLRNSTQTLENTAYRGKKWNSGEPCGTPEKPFNGRYGTRTCDP